MSKEALSSLLTANGLPYLIAVSYTHLDVYKRQALNKASIILMIKQTAPIYSVSAIKSLNITELIAPF